MPMNSHQVNLLEREGQFFLTGHLTFANVMAIYHKSLTLFANASKLEVNFVELTSSDSSGIALIFEWLKEAKRLQKSIHFHHLPADLRSIAGAAGLDELLSV